MTTWFERRPSKQMKNPSFVPGPPSSQLGQFHTLEDEHVEFEPVDTKVKQIAAEDRTAERVSQGPAKYNSPAFRDGWARAFGKN